MTDMERSWLDVLLARSAEATLLGDDAYAVQMRDEAWAFLDRAICNHMAYLREVEHHLARAGDTEP